MARVSRPKLSVGRFGGPSGRTRDRGRSRRHGIGCHTTIDHGALRDKEIGTCARLDNQVQVAHGGRIGRNCAIAALAGISGSVEIGDFVVMGGQIGVAEHVTIGSKARIGAQSGVISELGPGVVAVGSPARPARQVFRETAVLKPLAQRQCQAPETR